MHPWFEELDWEALYRKELRPDFAPSNNALEPEYFCQENHASESPNADAAHEYTPTYNGFSYSAGSGCKVELEFKDN